MNVTRIDQSLRDAQPDPLLACLVAVTASHDRAASVDAITAGLPLIDGRLTPKLLVEAAARAGYAASIVKCPLKKLNNLNLPAIVLLKEQNSCVLLNRAKSGKVRIYNPLVNATTASTIAELDKDHTGFVILLKPQLKLTGVADDDFSPRSEGHWFWGVIWRLWPSYARVFVAAFIINMLALASPLFIMNVYDRVLPNKATSTLWVLASGMALAVIFDLSLRTVRAWLVDSSGRRADVLLSSKIFEHLMAIKMSGRPKTTGSFANQLREFENVREFFTSGTITTLTDFCFFSVFLAAIYYIGGNMALIPAGAALLVLTIGLVLQYPLHVAARKSHKESAYRMSLLVEAIASLETIKAIRAEGTLQRTWELLVGETSKNLEQTRRLSAVVSNLTVSVQQLVSVVIVIVGSYQFDHGEMSMGAIIACVILASRAVGPFGNFSMLVARSQQSFVSLKALNEVMNIESERPAGKNYVSQPINGGKIEFKSVTFSYPEAAKPAIRDFNLTIKPGERVGIIGKIGSGKTTLGRLLAGIYLPDTGNILIDGIDLRQFHPHELRGAIGVVTQDADLFYGTVRSNILMGSRNASDEDFVAAAKLAGVDDFAMKHPLGFDMPVGERGGLLSGGQRQSVTLARVFLLNPKVVFLDEPSGSMDLASERVLIEHLRNALSTDATIIICTHRYSMLELVDRLVVLADGHPAIDGPRDNVLEALKNQALARSR